MNKIKDYLSIATSIIVIIGLPIALYQIHQTKVAEQESELIQNTSEQTASASFMVEFNNELRNASPSYSSLINAIATNKPIFAPKGTFTNENVDNYLVMWELLDRLTFENLINAPMAYDAFSYDVEAAYCSPEIKTYVLQSRKEDQNQAEYGGFTDLAREYLHDDQNKPCSADFIDPDYEE